LAPTQVALSCGVSSIAFRMIFPTSATGESGLYHWEMYQGGAPALPAHFTISPRRGAIPSAKDFLRVCLAVERSGSHLQPTGVHRHGTVHGASAAARKIPRKMVPPRQPMPLVYSGKHSPCIRPARIIEKCAAANGRSIRAIHGLTASVQRVNHRYARARPASTVRGGIRGSRAAGHRVGHQGGEAVRAAALPCQGPLHAGRHVARGFTCRVMVEILARRGVHQSPGRKGAGTWGANEDDRDFPERGA